jgi:predicted nucleotidyltransferase
MMKKMKMLDVDRVDLSTLAEALEDHSEDSSWWIDPRTGELESWSRLFAEDPDDSPGERGFRRIEPLGSGDSYADMEEFTERVADRRARDLLAHAIAGRGAFRRFKDTLHEFPELRKEWFAFHDTRMARRAIEWLRDEGLIAEAAAERAIAAHPDPEVTTGSSDEQLARRVARELRELYGERLKQVVLFGSRARGDADPDSDMDLIVVLDPMEDRWAEHDRMDELLWRETLETGIVLSAIPLSVKEFDEPKTMAIRSARMEGRAVG